MIFLARFFRRHPTQLDRIEGMLSQLLTRWEKAMTTYDDAFAALTTSVTANTSAEQSIQAVIAGIEQQLRDLSTTKPSFTPDDLMALAKQIGSNNDALTQAALANTSVAPAAPAAAPTPAPAAADASAPAPTPDASAPAPTPAAPDPSAPTPAAT